MDDADGVLGTFCVIQKKAKPTRDEQILSMMSTGNYYEVQPMLSGKVEGQELLLVKCLLRSNQPYLAQVTLKHLLSPAVDNQMDVVEELSDDVRQKLINYQFEATCRLGDWEQLEELEHKYLSPILPHQNSSFLGKNSSFSDLSLRIFTPGKAVDFKHDIKPQLPLKVDNSLSVSWNARLSMIFSSLKQYNNLAFEARILEARCSLMDELKAITYEESEVFSQTHRYILKLRSLFEVEEMKKVIVNSHFNERGRILQELFTRWEKQSDVVCTNSSLSESISTIRQDLLRTANFPNTSQTLCRLLLQSSRLARKAGHLQTAWSYLVEARQLDLSDPNIDIEEARYMFAKGDQSNAINLLRRTINRNFPEMDKLVQLYCRNKGKLPESIDKSCFEDFRCRKPFVEATLLVADLTQRAGACRMDDLLMLYKSLEEYGECSETFYYRFAVFYDNYCESIKELSTDMVRTLIRLYRSVLEQGDYYLAHSMPRMLNIWLNLTQKCQVAEMAPTRNSSAGKTSKTKQQSANKSECSPNKEMRISFDVLDPYFFFTSFSQLFSRITHSDAETYDVLKHILAELVVLYPHQALWLSMAHARASPLKQAVRAKRSNEIFDLAKKKASSNSSYGSSIDLGLLIRQHEYLASALMKIANHDVKFSSKINVSQLLPFLADFFVEGMMVPIVDNSKHGQKSSSGYVQQKNVIKGNGKPPRIILPFHEDVICTAARCNGISANRSSINSESQIVVTSRSSLSPLNPSLEIIGDNSVQLMGPPKNRRSGSAVQVSSTTNGRRSHYSFNEVYIHGVDSVVEVFKSLSSPKKLTMIGTDGRRYQVLCKGTDQLFKDSRVMDLNRMLNTLFAKDNEAKRRNLSIRCYSVIPLQEEGGIIEFVPEMISFTGALKPLMKGINPFSELSNAELSKIVGMPPTKLSLEERIKVYREKVLSAYPLVLAEWFRRMFPEACQWYNARRAFVQTTATMSIVGFILGLGDRHGENLLIDTKSGECMHVDFNILFNRGEALKVPEIVPFRLTRNMIDGFGSTGVEGSFRKACEAAMRVMRSEQQMLGTVLEAFAYDPLVEWTSTESRNQQARQNAGGGNATIQNGGNLQRVHEVVQNDIIEMIRLRLAGHIVTVYLQRPEKNSAIPMSVEGQVASLIDTACDEENLVRMYCGWSPFI